MMLIDTHVHWPMQDNPAPNELLRLLDDLQIDAGVVSGWEILFKQPPMDEYNTRLARFCNQSGGRLTALGTVHLTQDRDALAEARRCIEKLGMKGFKVHSWVQGECMFNDVMYALCEYCGQEDVPIMFHDGTPAYAMSSQVGVLAQMFPQTTLVLGHGGILHYWQEALAVAQQNDNIHVTLCGPHLWALQRLYGGIDPRRIVFGTDIIDASSRDVAAYRRELFELVKMSDADRELLSSQNARKLYGITL